MNELPKTRKHDHRLITRTLLLAVTIVSSGCAEESTGPPTYPVTGAVTLAGQLVEGAVVQFTPTSDAAGTVGAQATTDAAGRFDVSIMLDMGKTTKRGLPPGEYAASIIKLERPSGASLDHPPKNVLPSKYADPKSSGLKASVAPDTTNEFQFQLEN